MSKSRADGFPAYLLYRSDGEHWECRTHKGAVALINEFCERYPEMRASDFRLYVRYDKYSAALRNTKAAFNTPRYAYE